MITGLKPGDVLCISDDTKAGWFVRFRDKLPWMRDATPLAPGVFSHTAMVTHTDKQGLPWGIEGKPSTVEFVDLTKYLNRPSTISNRNQPKTPQQRQELVRIMMALYAVKYDWSAIVELGTKTFGSKFTNYAREWRDDGPKDLPLRVVCSSSNDYAYEVVGLDNPGGSHVTRTTTPDMWGDFILRNGWS